MKNRPILRIYLPGLITYSKSDINSQIILAFLSLSVQKRSSPSAFATGSQGLNFRRRGEDIVAKVEFGKVCSALI